MHDAPIGAPRQLGSALRIELAHHDVGQLQLRHLEDRHRVTAHDERALDFPDVRQGVLNRLGEREGFHGPPVNCCLTRLQMPSPFGGVALLSSA